MKISLLFTLLSVVFLSGHVYGEEEDEIKKSAFPFMAFIYYSHESVVDLTGNRFLRGAVLIRPDWLVTSAIQISSNDEEVRFPQKTLLARVGATTIDVNFTLSEDEDEQEREIIQIVRPSNHSATQWWQADITLMKTLLPFNISSVVSPATLHPRSESTAQSCSILVYAKKHANMAENRILMQLPVKLLTPSIDTCGIHFYEDTMTCASDRDDDNKTVYDPNFCQGNNGGPLICEGKVMGLQTYIDNNCKPPHLYQLLSVWDKFIFCGTKNKCGETECSNRCVVTNKDSVTSTTLRRPTDWEEATMITKAESIVELVENTPKRTIKTTEEKILTTKEKIVTTEPTTSTERATRTTVPMTSRITSTMSEVTEKISWPKKTVEDEDDTREEKFEDLNVESLQKHELVNEKQQPVVRSATGRNTSMTQIVFIACILASVI